MKNEKIKNKNLENEENEENKGNDESEKLFEELDESEVYSRARRWRVDKIRKDLSGISKPVRARADKLWNRWHGGKQSRAWAYYICKKIRETVGFEAHYETDEAGQVWIKIYPPS